MFNALKLQFQDRRVPPLPGACFLNVAYLTAVQNKNLSAPCVKTLLNEETEIHFEILAYSNPYDALVRQPPNNAARAR